MSFDKQKSVHDAFFLFIFIPYDIISKETDLLLIKEVMWLWEVIKLQS
jgi:hypothetical protein